MTKEELIAENARLKQELESVKAEDANVRHYLSVALGAGKCKKDNSYGADRQYVYNWFEVFEEIGKLLEKKRYTNLEKAIEHVEYVSMKNYKEIIKMLQHHFPDKFKKEGSPIYRDY